jgi:hypothetical protein
MRFGKHSKEVGEGKTVSGCRGGFYFVVCFRYAWKALWGGLRRKKVPSQSSWFYNPNFFSQVSLKDLVPTEVSFE